MVVLRLVVRRLCSLEPGSSAPLLSLSLSSFWWILIARLLAFRVPLVALPDAPPSWNSRFSSSRPPLPLSRSPRRASLPREFYRARYPRCRLRFILQLSLIQRIPWSVIITPGHFRLLLFSTRFSFVRLVYLCCLGTLVASDRRMVIGPVPFVQNLGYDLALVLFDISISRNR